MKNILASRNILGRKGILKKDKNEHKNDNTFQDEPNGNIDLNRISTTELNIIAPTAVKTHDSIHDDSRMMESNQYTYNPDEIDRIQESLTSTTSNTSNINNDLLAGTTSQATTVSRRERISRLLRKTTGSRMSAISDYYSNNSNNKNKKAHSHKHKSKKDDGPISLAVLTEEGILIKSRKPKAYEYSEEYAALINNVRPSMSSSRTSVSRSDAESYFETASYVSCVTCLSDSVSTLSLESASVKDATNTELDKNGLADIDNDNSKNSENTASSNSSSNRNYASVNGQIPTNSVIPFKIILNAKYIDPSTLNSNNEKKSLVNPDSNQHLIEITFAKPRRQDVVPKRLTLLIEYDFSNMRNSDNTNDDDNIDIVEEILKRSYVNSKRHRNILVIINPFGGKRNAKKIFMRKSKRLLMASGFKFDIRYTKYNGHGIEIAQNMNIDKYDTIVCASGDGIPHEVINGLYRRPDRVKAFNKIAISQIPCGSGNAMSVSCHWTNNPSYATLFLIKSIETRCDVMCMSQPSYKDNIPHLSFLSQTYGIIAESDINTEFIRWLGPARFELGVAFNIFQRKSYPCDIYVKYFKKGKNELKLHYLQELDQLNESMNSDINENEMNIDQVITEDMFAIKYPLNQDLPDDWEKISSDITDNLGIFYTGKMPYMAADTKFFPAALPSDGVMDMVITDSRTPFTRMIPILLALDKGSHVLQPEVLHSKIYAYRLIPKKNSKANNVSSMNVSPNETQDRKNVDGNFETFIVENSMTETSGITNSSIRKAGNLDDDNNNEIDVDINNKIDENTGNNYDDTTTTTITTAENLHSTINHKDMKNQHSSIKFKEDKYTNTINSANGLFSIDGEKYPLEPLQVEILPKLCKFLLRDGRFVDTEFGDM